MTGVARARDRLDSAASTSSLQEKDIVKIAPTSIADLFRNIRGVRSEAGTGTTNGSCTIRGLPLVSTGAKYLQFQEDGLPVLEFGDIFNVTPDLFIRADLNIAPGSDRCVSCYNAPSPRQCASISERQSPGWA